MRGMRNAYYARDNFDVRHGGRGFSCAVKNTLISLKDAVDTCTFRVKPNTPPIARAGKKWRPTLGSPLYIYAPHSTFGRDGVLGQQLETRCLSLRESSPKKGVIQ